MASSAGQPLADDRSRSTGGLLLVAVGAVCFSTVIIFTRLTRGLDVMAIAFFRAFFACLFFTALLPRFPEALRVGRYRRSLWALLGLGAAVGLSAALYIYAIQHTTAANAALLINSATLYVALLAPWLLKEPRPRYIRVGLVLAVIGIICISNPAGLDLHSGSFAGIVAGVCSGFTYSLTMLFSRSLRGQVSSLTQVWWSSGIAALLLSPWVLRAPWTTITANLPVLVPLGIVSLGLAYLLYFTGLQRVSAQVVSVVALLEPVSGALMGLFLFHELPTPVGVLGSLLILTSIFLISR